MHFEKSTLTATKAPAESKQRKERRAERFKFVFAPQSEQSGTVRNAERSAGTPNKRTPERMLESAEAEKEAKALRKPEWSVVVVGVAVSVEAGKQGRRKPKGAESSRESTTERFQSGALKINFVSFRAFSSAFSAEGISLLFPLLPQKLLKESDERQNKGPWSRGMTSP